MSSEDRLSRIEEQLSLLHAKFDALIRLEERHNALSVRVDSTQDSIHKHTTLLMELQHKVGVNAKTVGGVEKFFWIAVAACFSLAIFAVREIK